MLELINVTSGYIRNQPILKGINLCLNEGDRLAILGQNGAGKSTIAKTIMGLMPEVTGEIKLDGKNILGKTHLQLIKAGIGYFMQGGRIFGHLTVLENIKVATQHLPKKQAQMQIENCLNTFDFFANLERTQLLATYLSGGERHQLALAMVFASTPNLRLLIADEPSAGISALSYDKLTQLLNIMVNQHKAILLLIEQNRALAKQQTYEQKVMANGQFTI